MKMRDNGRWLQAAALATLVLAQAGCTLVGREEIQAVRDQPEPASPLHQALKAEYLDLTAAESAEKDWFDAGLFLDKAARAGRGEDVAPQPLAQRYILSAAAEAELVQARAELSSLDTPRAVRRAPRELARAQARFDCWLQEQEEGTQPKDIAACRQGFRQAVAEVREKAALGQDVFVVIEGEDGHVGAIAVTSGEQRVVLDEFLAAAHVRGEAGLEAVEMAPEEVEELFSAALAAKPLPPASFSLYFITDSLELTPASKPMLQAVYREIARRPVAEVTVIGHTDRVGRTAYNDRLSRQRAQEVRAFLVGEGIDADMITTAGRGEREPLVPTADGVEEARNRRAEVSIR